MPESWRFSTDYYRRSQEVLETALSQVGAYKSWRAFDPGREYPIDARYAAMPALVKRDIRDNFPEGLMPPGRDIKAGLENREIAFIETSGTLGNRVPNIWNQKWWDASERASWTLNSHASKAATGNHPEALLANPINVGFISDDADLPMEKRRLARFLYLNEKTDPNSWSPELMDRMIDEIGVFKPAVLEANPSLLARLCRYVAANNKRVFQPGLITFTYEYPTRFHYQQIRKVFDAPTASSYGATEVGYVFMQCDEGRLHQNTDFCRVDFQPLKPEHGGPELGRILITTFDNPWFYILRFDVGDLARIEKSGRCPCGRDSGMILSRVEGRAANLTLTCTGRLVTLGELDNAISVLTVIDEYQLEQADSDVYYLHLVSQRPDNNTLTGEAAEVLKGLYGREAKVSVIYEKALTPEISGKYSISKALFPIDIGQYLDERYLPRRLDNTK